MKNQERLRQNWSHEGNQGVPREGSALLQGMVYCGVCGRKIGAGLLRPPPGLLPQPGPGSRQAHPRLVRSALPARPRHPARQRQARPRRRRHQGRQGRTQDARSQKAPSRIRVQQQGGVHLRPLLPGGRCAHPSLVQRICLAFGLSHPRRHGVFQPRPTNPAGQDDPAARLAGTEATVLLRGRRLLCQRQSSSRAAGPGKPPGHARQKQQRSFLPGDTPAAAPAAAPRAGPPSTARRSRSQRC